MPFYGLEGQFDLVGWGTLLSGFAAVMLVFITVTGLRNRRDVKQINKAVNNSDEDEDDPRHLRDIAKDISSELAEMRNESDRRHASNEERLARIEGRTGRIEGQLTTGNTRFAAIQAQLERRDLKDDRRNDATDRQDDADRLRDDRPPRLHRDEED
jgi:biopolymer transport protein ExbB/TolQ